MDGRDKPQRCSRCRRKSHRIFSPPGIKGEYEEQHFYEYERNAWDMATGQQHEKPKDLEAWCHKNGKQIVSKGYKPPKPPDFEEKEALDALDKIYETNHNLGDIRS